MADNFERAQGLAIVTGAASGMGEAAAAILARTPGELLLLDVNAERLADAAARLPQPAETLAGDISAPDFPARLIEAIGSRRVAAFIHCAGLSPTMASAERILEVNLAATMRLVDAVRPLMAKDGAAVLFASMAAHGPAAAFDGALATIDRPEDVASLQSLASDPGAAYSLSKRGVYLWVQRQAGAFGQLGARIASISPGIIDTPMGRAEMVEHPVMQQIVAVSALKRSARAEELAGVAVFLCSPWASFISGTDILVDAGAVAGAAYAGGG
jgi:NAD(P)-dependent dehydrogenase (short-subunit alcohol dehydrogenase family)